MVIKNKMRKPVIIILNILFFLIVIIFLMQIPISEIKRTVIKAYSVQANFNRFNDLKIDSIPFFKMNWKGKYIQCKNDSCISNLDIKHMIAIHNFFTGKIYYEYSHSVLDKNKKPVYGCKDVPAWVKITRRNGKWWIVDFYEKP
jgi:hypothetical protein